MSIIRVARREATAEEARTLVRRTASGAVQEYGNQVALVLFFTDVEPPQEVRLSGEALIAYLFIRRDDLHDEIADAKRTLSDHGIDSDGSLSDGIDLLVGRLRRGKR